MTRAATGYPFTGHKSLAELWGLAEPAAQIDEQSRHLARLAVVAHLRMAADALRQRQPIRWAAHAEIADEIAKAYKVAWEDPALVRCPLAERQS